ncbi:MAG TPA: T9SS type A sorting domain-containing protein [Saprospiraceae bacterium]|nr:T9SS type A sorting domain-containing protein [Saprospiraceae bacterium]HRO09247.1 T9SS type A sorting domain-containing protein [Saprospiraceae bacterium]HRP42609.1 T9SS type A sorting domain-containing protein [Saprospiraceae bacterium]
MRTNFHFSLLVFSTLLFFNLSAQTPKDLIIGATVYPIPEEDSVMISWQSKDTGNILINSITNGPLKLIKKVNIQQSQTKIHVKQGEYLNIKLVSESNQNQIQILTASNYFVEAPKQKSVLLLVTPLIDTGAAPEVERWINDVTMEGWTVTKLVIQEDALPPVVKDTIYNMYKKSTEAPLAGVFILGHIPVPYSGLLNPDGHADHLGAWPADGYYVDFNSSSYFTDKNVDTDKSDNPPSREANRNIPGDGKFDSSIFASTVELWIGRVDMSNLSFFSDVDTSFTELYLTKRYLDKDHAFRRNQIRPKEGTIIDDNFGYFGGEAFASNGWMVGRQFMDDSLIEAGDFFNSSKDRSFLWGYGCGGGNYTGASGVGDSKQFAKDSVNIVFSMLFGSYFGDWDSKNNFMRSALASKGMLLTCVWAGRPDWFFHRMTANLPIGESVRESFNAGQAYSTAYAQKWVHMALMGDPTLRNHSIMPPTEVAIRGEGPVYTMEWTSAPDTSVNYFIFRKSEKETYFRLLRSSPGTVLTYIDSSALPGLNTYAILAGKKIQNRSGIHYAMSNGIYADATYTPSTTLQYQVDKKYFITPNPSYGHSQLHLDPSRLDDIKVLITDLSGKIIFTSMVDKNVTKFILPVLSSGMYVVSLQILKHGETIELKWIVQ